MMKKSNKASHKRKGGCIVDFFVSFILLLIILSTLFAFDMGFARHGLLIGILYGATVFVITTSIALIALCVVAKTLEFFDTVPRHCESGKCNLFLDCYKVRLSESIPYFLYYKCQCGKDYIAYNDRFFAKINDNGSLEPYRVKYTAIFGFERWCDDKRMDAEVRHLAIPMDILQQLRNKSMSSSFVSRDNTSYLVLCTPCDLIVKND